MTRISHIAHSASGERKALSVYAKQLDYRNLDEWINECGSE